MLAYTSKHNEMNVEELLEFVETDVKDDGLAMGDHALPSKTQDIENCTIFSHDKSVKEPKNIDVNEKEKNCTFRTSQHEHLRQDVLIGEHSAATTIYVFLTWRISLDREGRCIVHSWDYIKLVRNSNYRCSKFNREYHIEHIHIHI